MSEPVEISCLVCESTGTTEPEADRLRDDPSGRFSVARCPSCRHVQLYPVPTPEEDAAFYARDGQVTPLTGVASLESMAAKCRDDTSRRLGWIRSLLPEADGPILDVGCGYGFLVDALAGAGYDALGLDASETRLALAREGHRGRFRHAEVTPDFVAGHRESFALVGAFHVLEHLREPVTFVRQCLELVRPGGHLILEVPNLADALLESVPAYRAFFWQRAHLSYFGPSPLELCLQRAGVGDFQIRGAQRYGVENLWQWVTRGEPQRDAPSFNTSQPALERLERLYREDREKTLSSDALVVEIRKEE